MCPLDDIASNFLKSCLSWDVLRLGAGFTHSAAQGTIAELETKEAYLSCDVSNPIRMYTDTTDSISLDGEGVRYFASSNSGKCKNGLKLHVEVIPQATPETDAPKILTSERSASAVADGPTPSGSAHLGACLAFLAAGFWLCYMSF